MYVDSHAHLESSKFDADRDEAIARARTGGVETMLTVGQVEENWASMDASLALARSYEFMVASIGMHPHDAKYFDEATGERMLDVSRDPKIVAWGECGLDFFYDNSPRDAQRAAFRAQLRLARRAELPVIVHSRDAAEETIAILREEVGDGGVPGVYHCFSYDQARAREAIELGFYVSFSGVVTYKTSDAIKEAAAAVPLDRILIETDSPFLAPVPHRGKRNEPLFVKDTAAEIARLRGVAVEAIARATSENFRRLFGARRELPSAAPA